MKWCKYKAYCVIKGESMDVLYYVAPSSGDGDPNSPPINI